jgi:hypothetical protein
VTYEVKLAGVTVKAGDVGEALEVAADLIEAAGSESPSAPFSGFEGLSRAHDEEPRDGLVVTCDGEPDEALTELAREGLRPLRNSRGEPRGEPFAL